MLKRIFDIVFSLLGIILLLPLFFIIAILIIFDSRGGVIYRQKRVGIKNSDFDLYKFRTMVKDADKSIRLTIGKKDDRITGTGRLLRKFKLDELPQLYNVLIGEMSVVGPRPEVREYIDLYTPDQRRVLAIKPGITDYASIEYANENELLGNAPDPELTYITQIIPAKLKLNLQYIKDQSFFTDVKIILKTLSRIFFDNKA